MIKYKIFKAGGLGIFSRHPFDILFKGDEGEEKVYERFKEMLLKYTFNGSIDDKDTLSDERTIIFPTKTILNPCVDQARSFLDYQLENFNRPEAEVTLDKLKYDFEKEMKRRPWDEDPEKYKDQPTLPRFYAVQSMMQILEKYTLGKPQSKKAAFIFDQSFSEQIIDVLINEVSQDSNNLDAVRRFAENTLLEGERVNFIGETASLSYFFYHLEKLGKLRTSLKLHKAIAVTFLFDGKEPTQYIEKIFKKSAHLERTPQHVSSELLSNNEHISEQLVQLGFPLPTTKLTR